MVDKLHKITAYLEKTRSLVEDLLSVYVIKERDIDLSELDGYLREVIDHLNGVIEYLKKLENITRQEADKLSKIESHKVILECLEEVKNVTKGLLTMDIAR